jgi:hypothetical protein
MATAPLLDRFARRVMEDTMHLSWEFRKQEMRFFMERQDTRWKCVETVGKGDFPVRNGGGPPLKRATAAEEDRNPKNSGEFSMNQVIHWRA